MVQLYSLPGSTTLANRSEAEMGGITQLEDSIRKSHFSLNFVPELLDLAHVTGLGGHSGQESIKP